MQRDSAAYMFGFAALVCVFCSIFVSTSAVTLKERQQINQALDRQRNVLYVTGLATPEQGLEREEVIALFEERIKPVIVDLESGEAVDDPPFEIDSYDQDKAAEDPQLGREAPPNQSNVARLPKYALTYQLLSESGDPEMFVLPIKGYGLWSTLYGYIALAEDGNTVEGITYYQHQETPGLGGEVDNPRWKSLWPGRRIYDDSGNVDIEVIKGQAGPSSSDPYRVDGLSGATITSRGVSNMFDLWFGPQGFKPYLDKFRQGG